MNIFTTPLTMREFVVGLISLSIIEGLLSFLVAIIIATTLYALDIWTFGFYIVPFFLNIFVFGWAIGLVTVGIIIRFGPSVEILVWSIPTLFYPLSAVFYPASVIPVFLQKIAYLIPTFHLFEGMRAVLIQNIFPVERIIWGSILSILYFLLALMFLAWMIRIARRRGYLARLTTD